MINKTLSLFFYCFFIFSVSSQTNEKTNKLFTGFFNFTYQESSDKIFLEVDKINKDFLNKISK